MDLIVIAAVLVGLNLYFIYYVWIKVPQKIEDAILRVKQVAVVTQANAVAEARTDAAKRSTVTRRGKLAEQLAPYMPGFKYHPSDARFMGSPIDLIVFDGLHEDNVKQIIIMEVKTGKSSLTTRERSVRNAVNEGRVRWEVLRLGEFDDET